MPVESLFMVGFWKVEQLQQYNTIRSVPVVHVKGVDCALLLLVIAHHFCSRGESMATSLRWPETLVDESTYRGCMQHCPVVVNRGQNRESMTCVRDLYFHSFILLSISNDLYCTATTSFSEVLWFMQVTLESSMLETDKIMYWRVRLKILKRW